MRTIFETLSAQGACLVAVTRRGEKHEINDSRGFMRNLCKFLIFLHEIFLIARSYRVIVTTTKSLIIGALVTMERRLKFPILSVFCRS